jgi:uncharacterized membrane protein
MEQTILSNSEIRSAASKMLNVKSYLGLFGIGILCLLIQCVVHIIIPSAIIGSIIGTFVNLIISIFCLKLSLDFVRTGEIVNNLGNACKMSYKRFLPYFGVTALMGLIIFLYCAIFVIIGLVSIVIGIGNKLFVILGFLSFIIAWIIAIIVSYRYRMAMFITCEDIQRPIRTVLRQSKELMGGNKAKLFLLDITYWFAFIGLIILIVILVTLCGTIGTLFALLGIFGFVFLLIHYGIANVIFYQNLRENSNTFDNDEELYSNYRQPMWLNIILLILVILWGVGQGIKAKEREKRKCDFRQMEMRGAKYNATIETESVNE